jgi:hypothetical protein
MTDLLDPPITPRKPAFNGFFVMVALLILTLSGIEAALSAMFF